MREITNDQETEGTYYMPHHGVHKPEKSSTPLRVVFNCSSLTTNGTSLNSIQLNGGVIQEDLFALILKFRTYIFAITADIEKMYRMILVHPNQHNLQRILWRDHANGEVKTFELNTVTYGTVSAPFLAMRTLLQLSLDEEKDFPLAAPVIRENFYMDDGLCGASNLEEAKELKRQLIAIFARAGMTLHKWSANHPELSSNENESYEFSYSDETKTLGVMWCPTKDCFSFRIEVDVQSTNTKRTVLSTISRIFDPLGLLGPIIAKAKMLMQSLWKFKIGWHDPLPLAEAIEWNKFLSDLNYIQVLEIDRCIVIEKATAIEFHGFSDASERCYGAVVYCKSWNALGQTKVKLVASKSRVAPIKSLTIPRLELCGAVLLSKLMKRILSAIKLKVTDVFYWSDSMIVLAWIQKDPLTLKTFVKNRVSSIQELTLVSHWFHVPSEQNPADLISRGADPAKLLNNPLWFNGPGFLSRCHDSYPKDTLTVSENDREFCQELKNFTENDESQLTVLSTTLRDFVYHILSLSNNYLFIIRVLSFIFRFVRNAQPSLEKVVGPLQVQELQQAENYLLREVQRVDFASDIQELRKKGRVSPGSKIKNLNPFVDTDGILRVGGRLGNSDFIFVKKYPAILPKSSNLTVLIVLSYHLKYLHVGPSGLLNLVRQKFWPLSGRSICRKIVHNCVQCVKAKPIASTQIMGNLPRERIFPDFPFNCTGVDLCGPFLIKYKHQRKGILQKIFICLFICFVSKAVHLEIVADLTSESFVAALKRFIARRGKCAKLFSDNARNFVGANKELKSFVNMVKKPNEKLASYLSAEGIEWKFIPPRAPNFGGLWEAAVKSVKYHLKRVIANARLTYEEFLTTITQIESILNSRPLCPLSEDTDDLEVLTPGHFLIGRSLTSIIEPDLSSLKENTLSKWQRVTKLVQLIWKKWHRSYLSNLQQRSKWRFEKNNVKIGDLVLLVEDNLPTHKWVMGRITEVYHGEDKKIRVVQVKTSSGTFKRSISKVCILPVAE